MSITRKFQPVLSDIFQVFLPEELLELEHTPFLKSEEILWGEDREVSIANSDTSIKSQWNRTCTSFATVAAIENKLFGQIELSERSLWDFYGVYSTSEAIGAAKLHYVLEEKYWPQYQPALDPRSRGKGRFKISRVTDLGKAYSKVLESIDNRNPCIVALSTPKDLQNGKYQVEATSKILRRSGHAMCVSGYKVEKGKGYFLCKNSWGKSCGKDGYQYIAFELFDEKGYIKFWSVEEVFDRGEQEVIKEFEYLLDDSDLPLS